MNPSTGGTFLRKADGTLEQITAPTGERPCRCRADHVDDQVVPVPQEPEPSTVVNVVPAVDKPWLFGSETNSE